MEPLFLHKDDFNAIIVSVDSHKFIIVQLVSYVKRMLPNCNDELEEHNSQVVESTYEIQVRIGEEINKSLKSELAISIKKVQQQLVTIQQNREAIQGALRDYVGIK